MKVDFEGRTWQLETEDISLEQGLQITAYTGLSLVAWEKSLLDPDGAGWLKSMRCLYWLMRAQNSEPVPLESADFAVLKLYLACAQAISAEAEAAGVAAEADPTRPAGDPAAAPMPPPPAESLSG